MSWSNSFLIECIIFAMSSNLTNQNKMRTCILTCIGLDIFRRSSSGDYEVLVEYYAPNRDNLIMTDGMFESNICRGQGIQKIARRKTADAK